MPFMIGEKLFAIGVDQIGSNSLLKPFSCSFLKWKKLNKMHLNMGSEWPAKLLGFASAGEVMITFLCRGLFPKAISDSACQECTPTPGGRSSWLQPQVTPFATGPYQMTFAMHGNWHKLQINLSFRSWIKHQPSRSLWLQPHMNQHLIWH